MILFSLFLAIGFLCLGMYCRSHFLSQKSLEKKNQYLQKAIQDADTICDNAAAVTAYKNIKLMLPEVQLRILQRQWPIALEKLRQINLVRNNSFLQDDVPTYTDQLNLYLDDMRDRCNALLTDTASLSPAIMWRIHNIEGSVKLLTAFLLLQNAQNPDKVQGIIRETLADFKSAIEAVDKTDVPPFEKNIPRWNFEMLTGEEYTKKMEAAKTDPEKNQVLKESLETLIPELGGYAPGEPVETKIKK